MTACACGSPLLTVAQTEHTLIVDLLWLDGDDRFEPLLLFPGVPLDDILVGLKDNSVLPDFRFPETQMVWAALALLLGGDVYLTPLMQSSELPLADGAAKPMFIRPEEQWREWSAATGPEGPYVELPWIRRTRSGLGQGPGAGRRRRPPRSGGPEKYSPRHWLGNSAVRCR